MSFPDRDTPSIKPHRVHNANAPIAPFGASSWSLAAIEPEDHRRYTIHFRDWPEGFQDFARHLAYSLINHGHPESFLEQGRLGTVRWPSSGSVAQILYRVRTQMRWLSTTWTGHHTDTPVRTPADLDSGHLDDLKGWCEERYPAPRTRAAHLGDIVRVWHMNPWLPAACRWPEPSWRHHDWQPKRRKEENKAIAIQESTFGPLLEWATAFVADFATDILSAHVHYQEHTARRLATSTKMTPVECLDWYASTATPLPIKPPWVPSKSGSVIGWHVLAYRHGLTPLSISNLPARYRKASFQTDKDLSHTALDIPVTGHFRGRSWIPFISVYDVTSGPGVMTREGGPLIRHLRSACLIVIAALTGMRPEEVLNLQHGSAMDPILRPGGSRLQLVRGRVFKGPSRLDNGERREPLQGVWATLPIAATAIYTMEKINRALEREGNLLFSVDGKTPIYTRTASSWITTFINFVNDRLVPHTAAPAGLTIPADPSGAISLKRFRRTLAWYLRHRPNGEATAAIQYQHVGTTMSEGYAGTKASGMPGLLLEEDWNHRMATVRHLSELLLDGQGIGGPAAERAIEATQRLPRLLLPADERRLRKDKTQDIYENPAAMALCVYNESTALCQKLRQSGKDTQPDLLGCVDGCPNTARTDEHIETVNRQTSALRYQAELVPLPLAQSMLARAERNDAIVKEFDVTRIVQTSRDSLPRDVNHGI